MRLLAFWSFFKEITDFHTLSYTSTTDPLLFHIPEAWKIQEIRQDVGLQIGQEIGRKKSDKKSDTKTDFTSDKKSDETADDKLD